MPTITKYKRIAAIVGAVSVLAVPLNALAIGERMEERQASGTPTGTYIFCSRLENGLPTLQNKAAERRSQILNRRQERVDLFKERRDKRGELLNSVRQNANERRSDRYEGLEERAQTDAQIAAVADFKAAVETAITARKAAIDAAIKAFQDGVDALAQKNQTQLQAAAESFKTAVDAAISKARTGCANESADPATVKAQFLKDMEAAQKIFQDARKNVEKIQPQLEALKKIRNDAIQDAILDFKTALQDAAKTLKAAFAETETDEDSSATTTP